jgi:hypothetical protein
MTLLKNLLTEARNQNRKKARSQTNHTYYNKQPTVLTFDVEGTELKVIEFLSAMECVKFDSSIRVEIEQ